MKLKRNQRLFLSHYSNFFYHTLQSTGLMLFKWTMFGLYLYGAKPTPGNNSILTKWALYLRNAAYVKWFGKIAVVRMLLGLFDLRKLLNLVIKLLFVLHGFSTMTSSITILLFDLPGFKLVLKLFKLPPEVLFRFGC